MRTSGIFLLLLILCSCSGKYKSDLKFNAAEPLRLAILPFVSVDDKGNIINEEGRIVVDNLGLISSEVEDTPAQAVRKSVIAELQKSSLDLLSTASVDIDLPHRGYGRNDGTIDLAKLLNTPASELCAKALNCDAVLSGRITRWDRSYYGLQSVNSVGIELTMRSAADNSIIYSATAEDSESRGITKIPTGFSDLVLEPIKGLDSEIIADLADRMVKKMLSPILLTDEKSATLSPPAVYAAAHDGKDRKISTQEPLIIVAFGSEGAKAFFSIGNAVPKTPMIEVGPGHYYGEYIPLKGDRFSNQQATVGLTDKAGRTSTAKVSGGNVSYP